MLPPLITLLFLAGLWLAASLALQMLAENLDRIVLALTGQSGACTSRPSWRDWHEA